MAEACRCSSQSGPAKSLMCEVSAAASRAAQIASKSSEV
jgi:hypothetical protein